MSRFKILLLGCVVWLVIGCSAAAKQDSDPEEAVPAPTLNAVFHPAGENSQPQATNQQADSVTVEPLFGASEPQEEVPTLTPLPTLTPVPTIAMRIEKIYSDGLNANWSLENSREVTYELEDSSFVYEGDYSLAYRAEVEYADLAFTVNEDSDEVYLRDEVLAVRFWLYSGDDYVETDDLAVSVVGSNAFPYWVANDDSVTVQDSNPVFPETRLYYLNVDEDIPPNTWFQVELWLNDLIFEPDYKYVTGIFLKNDEDFLRTISIDDLELLIRVN